MYKNMNYQALAIAVLALVIVVLLPSVLTGKQGAAALTDSDVDKIARNYVETSFNDTVVTATQLTDKANGVWQITVTYQQGAGSRCKVGKCYWQGPASMYCRVESSQTLGQCT